MPIIRTFEDVIAWQKAKGLSVDIYTAFKNCRDFSFKSQIERAAVSIMNNIAEGFERQTDKELRNFLFIAKGSSGELRSMLALATDLRYITKSQQDILSKKSIEISKILGGFIKTL